ncbi:MAG: polysulfide reductase NrfD [Arenicellales bacterium]|nr:polysulfide reductase NrfD [Arenicellales bacterium]
MSGPAYWMLLVVLSVFLGAGLMAANYMEHEGHWITGMTNQIVWGMPHVFAIFLIVAASGALNVASLGSVFNIDQYKPLARISGLLAIALLIGGLVVLVLDLGRPDRLIVAMTTYNFKSIFAWNIFLYTGFTLIAAVYLWMLFEPRMGGFSKQVGWFAFVWRFVLTTGTGSIFGFLVARDAYDAAIMAPLFVAMSLALGTAVFLLVTLSIYNLTGRVEDWEWTKKLRRLNGIFVAVVLYFVAVHHLANLYVAQHIEVERFILLEGGAITLIFWVGQVLVGSILPMVIFFSSRFDALHWTLVGVTLVIVGGICQLYVTVIGGQAFPLDLFPGMHESSQFFDGAVEQYVPSLPELILGIGGIALALMIVVVAMRVLPFLPDLSHRSGVKP